MARSGDVYVGAGPTKGVTITELHCWIATATDGSEGIISADMVMPEGMGIRHIPLLSSNLETAMRLESMARRSIDAANSEGHGIDNIRLIRFRRVEDA